jgi:ABC-type sugar transport system substrate-binding protein
VAGQLDRRSLLRYAGATGLAGSAFAVAGCTANSASKSASSAAATTGTASKGKGGTMVWATHVYYNQPALVGISVGFHDFLDPLGWNFKVTAARTTGDTQETVQAQQQALQLHPDAIIATMQDPTSYNATLKSIVKAGIFLELNNTQPASGNGLGLPFVGQDFTAAGVNVISKVCAAAVANGKKSGPILLGYCCADAGAVGTRTVGLKAGLKAFNAANGTNFTTTELLDTSDTNPAGALSTWQSKLAQVGDKIVGIVCDQVGDPSIEAAKAAGKKPGFVPIATFDVTAARLQSLNQGWFIAVVDQQPYAQGYVAAAQAWAYLTAKMQPVDLYNTGNAIITKANLASTLEGEAYIAKRAKELGLAT